MNISPFHVWAIIRLLPDMRRVVVNWLRRRSDVEEYLRVLQRTAPAHDYTLLYYSPGDPFKPMVRKEHNKLVRDRIPEILAQQQVPFAVEAMSPVDYRQALRQKLVEEAQEAATAPDADLITELADLWEVMDATLQAYGLDRQQVLACQRQRQLERGGFTRRLRLLWTETEP
jgi:predicted house-cleaning noncanonical NTP pyrophosphatase (MazG superfamily)